MIGEQSLIIKDMAPKKIVAPSAVISIAESKRKHARETLTTHLFRPVLVSNPSPSSVTPEVSEYVVELEASVFSTYGSSTSSSALEDYHDHIKAIVANAPAIVKDILEQLKHVEVSKAAGPTSRTGPAATAGGSETDNIQPLQIQYTKLLRSHFSPKVVGSCHPSKIMTLSDKKVAESKAKKRAKAEVYVTEAKKSAICPYCQKTIQKRMNQNTLLAEDERVRKIQNDNEQFCDCGDEEEEESSGEDETA